MATQYMISEEIQALIPAELMKNFADLSFGEMAEQPECAEWRDELLAAEAAWYETDDA